MMYSVSKLCVVVMMVGSAIAEDVSARLPCLETVARHGKDAECHARAVQTAASMNIGKLAGQIILTGVQGRDTIPYATRQMLTRTPVGGIVLYEYNIASSSENTRIFVEELVNITSGLTLPPFIAMDHEGGAVQRIRGAAVLPAPLAYRATGKPISAIEEDAVRAGRELRRIGITLNLAPVAEVLTEENKPFLKTRSYGTDLTFTTDAAAAFIRGMRAACIASTLKHFPGNTAVDPHYREAIIDVSETELELKIKPFKELVRRESPAAIMLSHVIVPTWDDKSLSRSPVAIRHLREMGFSGIIIADDFFMAGSGAPPETAIPEAIAAGVDMIITWPANLDSVHRLILNALKAGTLSEGRVRDAATRIIQQKIRYGVVS